MSFSNISLGMLIMNASNIWALVQPCVACLLGASRKAGASVWASHIPCLKSLKQTVGLASTSAVPAIIRNVTAQHSFASVSAKPSREKKDRHGADNKEDDSRLVSVVLRKDIKGIGRQGDVVQVKRGRMRHELYPNHEAVYGTPEQIAKYALTDEQRESRDANAQEGVLEKLLRALSRKSVIISRFCSNEDLERFHGTAVVSPEHIRRAVLRQLSIQLDPSHFLSEADITTYGTFKVPLNLRLPNDQQIELTVQVGRRQKDAQSAATRTTVATAGQPE